MKNTGKELNVYFLFVISWFLHLGSRWPILGIVRFDLLLVGILAFFALSKKNGDDAAKTQTDKLLRILIVYAILTLPFVEWPGSVIGNGIPNFIKAIVFYYFTIAFVRTEQDLKKFITVFLACQLFRILEPLYLHLTEGYWGAFASMADWEYLERLSGAPSDVVNPNGLAFIVCTVLPFLYFLAGQSWKSKLAFICFAPLCLYVLALTGSRTGILGLVVVYVGILVKSKKRVLVGAVGALIVVVGFPLMSSDMQDRYLSIVGKGAKNEGTAEGRFTGVEENFRVAFRRPLFGHGLGTSREANANFGTDDQPAHNLYAEVAQELGFVGLAIFLAFLKSVFAAFAQCKRAYADVDGVEFLSNIVDALQVWLWMNLIFSFASYGLSSFEWYLLSGFAVVLTRLTASKVANKSDSSMQPAAVSETSGAFRDGA
jgi:putative inorganic carbon (HCO3(-)) transporter